MSLGSRESLCMCSGGQPSGDSPGSYKDRRQVRGRIGVLLCVFALVLQYVTPVLHLWGESTLPTVRNLPTEKEPSLLDNASPPTLLLVASTFQKCLPHDAASCTVCQACAHHRTWIATHVRTVWCPTIASVVFLCPILRPVRLLHAVVAARAPPSS